MVVTLHPVLPSLPPRSAKLGTTQPCKPSASAPITSVLGIMTLPHLWRPPRSHLPPPPPSFQAIAEMANQQPTPLAAHGSGGAPSYHTTCPAFLSTSIPEEEMWPPNTKPLAANLNGVRSPVMNRSAPSLMGFGCITA
jgi:hypothetical protein